MASAGKVAAAAPIALMKLRRLADPGRIGNVSGNFSLGAIRLLLPVIRRRNGAGLTVTFYPLRSD